MNKASNIISIIAVVIILLVNAKKSFAEEYKTELRQQAIEISNNHYNKSSTPTESVVQQALLQAYQQDGNKLSEPSSMGMAVYPIHSTMLTPGQVVVHQQSFLNLAHPIFLVGSDNLSYQWLIKNAAQLQKLGDVAFLC